VNLEIYKSRELMANDTDLNEYPVPTVTKN